VRALGFAEKVYILLASDPDTQSWQPIVTVGNSPSIVSTRGPQPERAIERYLDTLETFYLNSSRVSGCHSETLLMRQLQAGKRHTHPSPPLSFPEAWAQTERLVPLFGVKGTFTSTLLTGSSGETFSGAASGVQIASGGYDGNYPVLLSVSGTNGCGFRAVSSGTTRNRSCECD
jgi:hypothetical protein